MHKSPQLNKYLYWKFKELDNWKRLKNLYTKKNNDTDIVICNLLLV